MDPEHPILIELERRGEGRKPSVSSYSSRCMHQKVRHGRFRRDYFGLNLNDAA